MMGNDSANGNDDQKEKMARRRKNGQNIDIAFEGGPCLIDFFACVCVNQSCIIKSCMLHGGLSYAILFNIEFNLYLLIFDDGS